MQVSKSGFQAGLHCLKRAYLSVHSPELAKAPSLGEQERMHTGRAVGELARRLFDGVLVETGSFDMERASEETKQAMGSDAEALFEAAFVTETGAVRVDVLERLPSGGWHLIEVKSSKSVKPEHLTDVAFQRAVALDAGVVIEKCSVMTISKEYVRGDSAPDVAEFFSSQDVTQEAVELEDAVRADLAHQLSALAQAEAPEVVPNVHCKRNGECPFLSHCWSKLSEFDVATLPYIKADVVLQLDEMGKRDLRSVPDTVSLNARQRLIASVVQSGVPYVSDELEGILACIKRPVHFIDFEAASSAMPEIKGVAPYQHVPFQWSDHVLDDGVRHLQFLHRDASDPRPDFARTLWSAISDAGTIVYYSSYEKTILKSLASSEFPCSELALQALEDRGLDLEALVKQHVYLPEFLGRSSIKRVYPALVPNGGYDGLQIKDGDTAMVEFKRMVKPSTLPEEAERIAVDLLKYCERDTEAMLQVFLALEELAKWPSAP